MPAGKKKMGERHWQPLAETDLPGSFSLKGKRKVGLEVEGNMKRMISR